MDFIEVKTGDMKQLVALSSIALVQPHEKGCVIMTTTGATLLAEHDVSAIAALECVSVKTPAVKEKPRVVMIR